ncbi:MAG TPA: hypothetical protein VKR55_02970 [Bradyrhizobium sp.]|uniref:hypothetical protein n=1 Tax=Bradyrhizobium sp. TaxID=376 RepID=UPI002B6E994A|nr:hypothetical protein [Bradyrhizobium sp.]HLZ01094.1 hypothetical protein [Bradyrhizobium sp.]
MISLSPLSGGFCIFKILPFSEDAQVAKAMRKKREANGSQSAKTFRKALLVNEQKRRLQDALEDDEIREELKFSYARDKQRLACDRR